jgi:hypothetical protein
MTGISGERLTNEKLISKALGRNNLSRTDQKQIGLLAKDLTAQVKSQAVFIKQLLESMNEPRTS